MDILYMNKQGTDALEEASFTLDRIVDLSWLRIPLLITASMKPRDIPGYDGLSNIMGSMNERLFVYLVSPYNIDDRYIYQQVRSVI